ncbi:MAG: response regulator [Syntrophorhabdaceae bacterium]|nr:response regulator [Syntrophorhabdaceae bacterium]
MNPINILLVEDDPNSVSITTYIFNKAGLGNNLQVVKCGEDAIAYLSGHGVYSNRKAYPFPSLVLLDLYMPGIDGFEVLSWVKKQKEFQDLPVVILTSSYDSEDIQRCYELGANNYLLKPISIDSVKEVIDIYTKPISDNPKVLLIDDDLDMRRLAMAQLKKRFPGIHIVEVGTPDELEPALAQGEYDIVITDYDLKWTNGLRLLRIMKTRWPRCPVIMCTGSGSEEIVAEALRLGIDDYVLKKQKHFVRLPNAVRLALARSRHLKDAVESNARYRALYERVPIGLFSCSLNGKLIDANPAFMRMLGFSSLESISSINLADRFADKEDRKKIASFEKLKKDIFSIETKLLKSDGSAIWTELKIYRVRDELKKRSYYEGTLIDITERKNLELQLRQATKMEAIGLLAGGIAHDFNNILTSIIGYGTLLQMKTAEDNPIRIYIDQIISASNKAANLTQNLLSFCRTKPQNLELIEVNKHILTTINLLKRLITEDIKLDVSILGEKIFIKADATQFDQVLFNLVTNARDAMPKGGRLMITTELVRLDNMLDLTLSFGEPGMYAGIYVTDTGYGIDSDKTEKIFDPFFTTKEVGKGTGLGLFTVYGVIKQHNGCIDIKSEKNKGTTFKIFFPVTEEEVKKDTPSPFLKQEKGSGTILLAEDNDEVRNLMIQILSDFGYKVIPASDGEEAIEIFKKTRDIDLLLFDSVMPKKNGREAYEEIRKIDPQIKVLFTSGYTKDIVLNKGIEDSEFHFISKPIKPTELLDKIKNILS